MRIWYWKNLANKLRKISPICGDIGKSSQKYRIFLYKKSSPLTKEKQENLVHYKQIPKIYQVLGETRCLTHYSTLRERG